MVFDLRENPLFPGWLYNPENGFFVYDNRHGKKGFADYGFNIVIKPLYREVSPFSEGLAAVSFDYDSYAKYGYINKEGEFEIEPQFSQASSFNSGMALVEWKGEDRKDDRAGYINKEGKVLYEFFSDKMSYTIPSEGMAIVWKRKRNSKKIFINTEGTVVFEFNTSKYPQFHEGLAAVSPPGEKEGFIDKKGNMVIPPIYKIVKNFGDGLAPVIDFTSQYYYYINKSGEKILEGRFTDAKSFSEGIAQVNWEDSEGNKKVSVINTSGEIVYTKPDHILRIKKIKNGLIPILEVEERFVEIKSYHKIGYVNTQGIEVWKPTR